MKKKVLIVDDSATVRTMIKDILEKDYEVIECSSGFEVLDYLDKNSCNLIITDLHMPKMNGYDLIRDIKKKYKFIPCILLTSEDGANAIKQAKEAGAATFLSKPFNPNQLKRLLMLTIGV